MNKVKDFFVTIALAIRYSLSFCWKNDRWDTIGRLVFTLVASWIGYMFVAISGRVINDVQQIILGDRSYGDGFMKLQVSFLYLAIVLLCGVGVNRMNWFFGNRFRMTLRPRNMKEIYAHRATLDVARVRSEEFDNLEQRINELPASWHTRFFFAEELYGIIMTFATFSCFAYSIIVKWPLFALILTTASISMVIAKFRIISGWWNLSQEMLPQHKTRSVMEKPFKNERSFVQAKMFDQPPHLLARIDANWKGILARYSDIRWISFKGESISNSVSIVGLLTVIWLALNQSVAGVIEIGTLTVIVASARAYQSNLESLIGSIADQWNAAKGVIMISRDFMGTKPLLVTEDPVMPSFDGPPGLRLKDVSFSYHGSDTLALKGVNVAFEPGTVTAIVGKSGGGKSTLGSLLLRHSDPTSGSIHVGDVNLRNIPPQGMARVVSGLTQEFMIDARTIAEEIASSRLGKPIDMAMVEEAARFAEFTPVVDEDPKGYESQIGVEFGGRDFSGGERKRLALARARYADTPVFILDEPDQSLDPDTAEKVMDNIFKLRGKVTVVIICHYVSITERCDKVVVIDSGEVAEQGRPEELLAQGGKYARLFKKDRARRDIDS